MSVATVFGEITAQVWLPWEDWDWEDPEDVLEALEWAWPESFEDDRPRIELRPAPRRATRVATVAEVLGADWRRVAAQRGLSGYDRPMPSRASEQ